MCACGVQCNDWPAVCIDVDVCLAPTCTGKDIVCNRHGAVYVSGVH